MINLNYFIIYWKKIYSLIIDNLFCSNIFDGLN